MAFGLQVEINVTGAISAGLSWSFVYTAKTTTYATYAAMSAAKGPRAVAQPEIRQ